jgi:hypothetical protein
VATLLDYLLDTRFVLHDPNAITFTDVQLIRCINKARDSVISQILAPQVVASFPLVSGQEAYAFATVVLPAVQNAIGALPGSARAVQSVVGANFVQTPNLKIPLEPITFTDANERYRLNPINSLPEAFTTLSAGDWLYVEPPPSGSGWSLEVRCVWLPNQMSQYADIENAVPSPFAEAVIPMEAARWAWSFNDDEDSADRFEQKAMREIAKISSAMPLPWASVPYSSIY